MSLFVTYEAETERLVIKEGFRETILLGSRAADFKQWLEETSSPVEGDEYNLVLNGQRRVCPLLLRRKRKDIVRELDIHASSSRW